MTTSDSSGTTNGKRRSTLQRMDDCHPFNGENRYTTTSRDGWLQLEWLNK